MARSFNGSSARISGANAPGPIGGDRRFISFWFRTTSVATRQTLYYEGDATGLLSMEIESSKLFFLVFPSLSSVVCPTVLVDNRWYHVAISCEPVAFGTAIIFLDGVFEADMSPGNVPTQSTNFSLGGHPSGVQFLTGQMAEVSKFSYNLGDGQPELSVVAAQLAKGFTPMNVRTSGVLSFYAPLVRDIIDLKSGLALTDNGPTTAFDHPRTFSV
jgi:hypothetical protein